MGKKLVVKIDTDKYRTPTQKELEDAKKYVVRRSEAASALSDIAEEEITEAAAEITQIAMRYDIEPTLFALDSNVNEDMMDEVATVMDNLEESLMEHLEDYTTAPAKNEGTRYLILALVLSLGHLNWGIRETLHQYLWRTLRQVEALIVSAKVAKLTPQAAVSMVRSSIGDFRGSSTYRSIMKYRHLYEAQYVRNGGQATYSDGTPNVQGVPISGVQAVLNVLKSAVDAAWLYNKQVEWASDGVVGYWQFRGSDFPCDACDEEVGFHELGEGEDMEIRMEYDPYPHPHCCCGRLPIYNKEQLENVG